MYQDSSSERTRSSRWHLAEAQRASTRTICTSWCPSSSATLASSSPTRANKKWQSKQHAANSSVHLISSHFKSFLFDLFIFFVQNSYFAAFSCPDYARSGNIATEDVTITAAPLEQFQHTMEPQLRKLGLHTSLKRGIVTLDTDFSICKKGDKLNPEQARLLVRILSLCLNDEWVDR